MSTKNLSQHPLVVMAPSQWAKLCDARRMYENRKALRQIEIQRTEDTNGR